MIKSITALAAILLASSASAETYSVNAVVKQVEIFQQTISETTSRQHCHIERVPVRVPVYSEHSSSGDVLGGMIIGGLIGKGATGNDRGAAVGAVIGGMIAADSNSNNVVGYQNVNKCQTVWEDVPVVIGSSYSVTYDWNGLVGVVNTNQRYFVGDTIKVEVTLH